MIPFWKRNRENRRTTTFILKNGGILLEKLITTFDGKRNPIRNFSCKELKLATNNYDTVNVVLDKVTVYPLRCKLYKGFLEDRQISVMKFESHEDCINNIVFTSQMCHKHILKLIGCCLETEIPILVYESLVKYGTLYDHIYHHDQPHYESLSWRQRLKITMEIANAFAYLHVGCSRPIVYSAINLSNFLLDEDYVPRLFDFSLAECIPEGQTEIIDEGVRGTRGHVAPEHHRKNVLHEKCDVYGFGALLLELLTGLNICDFFLMYEKHCQLKSSSETKKTKDAGVEISSETEEEDLGSIDVGIEISFETEDEDLVCSSETNKTRDAGIGISSETEDEDLECSFDDMKDGDWRRGNVDMWGTVFKKLIEDNRFIEIVDPKIVGDGLCPEIEQQLMVFADLAFKCLSISPEDRPTMIEAGKQLRQLYLSA